jgi:dihydropteroate synthase
MTGTTGTTGHGDTPPAWPGPPGLGGRPALDRCLVMGVVNVTPDSFSDGGRWLDPEAAVAHGLQLAAEGADLIDVGGESTRPGAGRVSAAEELRRVGPVVAGLVSAGLTVSIDTTRAEVAAAALGAGAVMVNDVSGGLADPAMHAVVRAASAGYVIMHWRGPSAVMGDLARYSDVVAEVCAELAQQADAAVGAGIDPDWIVIDPGIGFAKRAEHNWALLADLPRVSRLNRSGPGFPLLVGASRKSFLGLLLTDQDGQPRPAAGRDEASLAVATLAAAAGAWCVRVHAAAASADAVRVAACWRQAEAAGSLSGPEHSVRSGSDAVEPSGSGPEGSVPAGTGGWG